MSLSLLYGFRSDDLETMRANVENTLGIEFVPHESQYHGGDYYLYENQHDGVEISLEYNRDLLYDSKHDPIEDFWAQPDYSNYHLLLYFNAENSEVGEAFYKRLDQVASIHFLKQLGKPSL